MYVSRTMVIKVRPYLNVILVFCHRKYICKCLVCIIGFFVLSYLLHPGRFAEYNYDYIDTKHIPYHLRPSKMLTNFHESDHSQLCTLCLNEKISKVAYPKMFVTKYDLNNMSKYRHIEPGGVWKPQECISKYQVAIIIPYRDREMHLKIFLSYMHPFLQSQNLEYRIIIVQQTSFHPFNRGKLFNIGFMEALKIYPYECFIFHDVDLIPQNLNNVYACTHQPRHMSSSLNTFRYNLPYKDLFGGAVAILRYHFESINGFSNEFFGWGGEDDDLRNRISNKGFQILRFSPDTATYMMLSHKKEPPSKTRFIILKAGSERYESDGLNSLTYDVLKIENRSLYTWILVNVLPGETNAQIQNLYD